MGKIDNDIAERIMGWHLDGIWWKDAEGCKNALAVDEPLEWDWPIWQPSKSWKQLGEVLGRLWGVRKYIYLNLIGFKDGAIWGLAHGGESEGTDGVDHPCEVACMAILEAWSDG